QLDGQLDVRSFELSDILLGDLALELPEGRGSFTGEFDFVKERGFVLQVTCGVDVESRIATWLLRAIDPETGLPVSDPTIGLLAGGGSGTVGYRIQATSEARNGSPVQASARVFFGNDTPLDSNTVVNTLDALAPVTTTSVTANGNHYSLRWTV